MNREDYQALSFVIFSVLAIGLVLIQENRIEILDNENKVLTEKINIILNFDRTNDFLDSARTVKDYGYIGDKAISIGTSYVDIVPPGDYLLSPKYVGCIARGGQLEEWSSAPFFRCQFPLYERMKYECVEGRDVTNDDIVFAGSCTWSAIEK